MKRLRAFGGLVVALVACGSACVCSEAADTPIDRQALVARHNPGVRSVDVDAPLTVGNGRFAFTADITGLQTFADHYHRRGVPTETLARWCWVTDENPRGYSLADAGQEFRQADGRIVSG